MPAESHNPRRALKTPRAADYIGVSPSLLRKMRQRGPDDPLPAGPAFIRIGPNLCVYEIRELDRWLEERRAKVSPDDCSQRHERATGAAA